LIGKTLAHYNITSKIGAGGMGEVYRARDTKLDRDVALKILPRELSGDPERAARFEREARTLASLQHPNIASIYGYEHVDGVRFLAMELVEGEDLSERLQRGAIGVDDAVDIARQIATGLEAAHERNIIHRDLKPANVKIDREGVVKILDFGLARALADEPDPDSDISGSPTITAAMTQAGVILGTAAYMSPEQARGKRIDKRSDIWAYGVILYEMLTGSTLYSGETVTDILGAIVHSVPDVDALPAGTPQGLRRLIGRCLTPEPSDRLRDIGEARYALAHLDRSVAPTFAPRSRGVWMWVALVLFVVAGGLAGLLWLQPQASTRAVQASIALPDEHTLLTTGPRGGSLRVSPDGRAIAFVAQSAGRRQIWVRQLDQREGYPVQGTEGGHRPFWSPDGRSLGFFSDSSLRRVSVRGGAALTIAAAPDGRGGVWLEDGTIVFAPTPGSHLLAVPAAGGEPRRITPEEQEGHREPRWLPVADLFLYLADAGGGNWMIRVGGLDGETHAELAISSGGAEYADGKLLYLRNRTLVAQPFDAGALQLSGEPTPIAEEIVRDPDYGIGVFSAAPSEVLAYQRRGTGGASLIWSARDGSHSDEIIERGDYSSTSLSPDGKTASLVITDDRGQSDIWLVDVDRGTRRRFTFTPDSVRRSQGDAIWSPDGRTIVFFIEQDGESALYSKSTDGSGEAVKIFEHQGSNFWPYDISPDGRWIVFGLEGSDSNEDLWILPFDGEGEARPLFETPFDEWPGRFSPDGRWLAFDSDEAGRREVYVIPFDRQSGKWQISSSGGRFPRWSDDGTELFFLDPEGALMSAAVQITGDTFAFEEPVQLFQADLSAGFYGTYDVDSLRDRFLLLESVGREAPISIHLNWSTSSDAR